MCVGGITHARVHTHTYTHTHTRTPGDAKSVSGMIHKKLKKLITLIIFRDAEGEQ